MSTRFVFIYISLLIISLFTTSVEAVNVTARGKFSHADHEAFSRITSDSLFHKGLEFLNIALTEPDSAMLCFSILANRYDDNPALCDPKTTVSSLINMSYLWREAYYDYPRAYNTNLKALKIAEDKNLDLHKPYIYMNMASILQNVEIGDSPLENSFEWLKRSIHAAIATNNHTLVQYATINLCESAIEQGSFETVAPEIEMIRNYKFPSTTPDMASTIDYTHHLLEAMDYFSRKDYASMVTAFEQAMQVVSEKPEWDSKLYLLALQLKISTLKMAGNTDNLPALLNQMLKEASEKNFHEYTIFALKGLRDYYSEKGQSTLARDYDYRYLHINDSLQRLNNLTRVKDLAFIAGLEDAGATVRRLATEKHTNKIIAICIGVAALIIILALIIYIRMQKRLHEANLNIYDHLQQQLTRSHDSEPIPAPQLSELPVEAEELKSESEENEPAAGISPEHAKEIFSKVSYVLETSTDIYSPEFSIRSLATLVGEPYYAVSAAINHCSGSNFKTLLMDYRLREACRRLTDHDNYGNQTVESIATSLGFKSRTYFNTVFKKFTGLTPAVYMKIAHTKATSPITAQ